MTGSSDAGGAMHLDPDVPGLVHRYVAGVQAHAHRKTELTQPSLRQRGRAERPCGGWKGDEERVTRCVHLDSAERPPRCSTHAVVIDQERSIALGAPLVEKPGRAFDVREQERHRPRRQFAHVSDHVIATDRCQVACVAPPGCWQSVGRP